MKNKTVTIKFKDGVTIDVTPDRHSTLSSICEEARKVYKDFKNSKYYDAPAKSVRGRTKDSKLKRSYTTNSSFTSLKRLKEMVNEGDFEALDAQVKLLKADMKADATHFDYVDQYSKRALEKILKEYATFINLLESTGEYSDELPELKDLYNATRVTFELDGDISTALRDSKMESEKLSASGVVASEVDPNITLEAKRERNNKFSRVNRGVLSGPTKTITIEFPGFSITDYERHVRHGNNPDVDIKELYYDKIIQSLNEDIEDVDRIHFFTKEELRTKLIPKYRQFATDFTEAGFVDEAKTINDLTDRLEKVWHLNVKE